MLVAALNPCPCGYRNDPRRECHCTPPQIERYMSKISGPLLDRIDIHIEVPRVEYEKLSDERMGEPSSAIQARVEAARERQRQRFLREIEIRVAAEWQQPDLERAVRLVHEGDLSLQGLVTHSQSAQAAAPAYRTAFGDPDCLKMIIDWRSAS